MLGIFRNGGVKAVYFAGDGLHESCNVSAVDEAWTSGGVLVSRERYSRCISGEKNEVAPEDAEEGPDGA